MAGFNRNHQWGWKANKITLGQDLKLITLVFIIKYAFTDCTLNALTSLSPVGAYGDTRAGREKTRKSHSEDPQGMGNHFGIRDPSSVTKESHVSILFSIRVPPPWKPTPALPGWLAYRRQGHRLTRATLAAVNWARDSADPDQNGLQALAALFVKSAPSQASGWVGGVGGCCCRGQAPHRHHQPSSTFLVVIDRDSRHNPTSANQSACFRNKLFLGFQNHSGA